MSQVVVMTPEELKRVVTEAVLEVAESLKPSPEKKRLLTTGEVELEYGIGRRVLEAWRSNGEGPPYTTIGRKMVRYEREKLDAWIAMGRVRTAKGD